MKNNMKKAIIFVCLVLVATLVVVGSVALRNKEQKMGNIEAPVVSDPDAPIIKKLCENRGDPTETAILFKCGKYYQKFPPTSALDLPSNLYDEEGVNVGNCGGNRNPDMPNSKGCEVSCDKQNLCLNFK